MDANAFPHLVALLEGRLSMYDIAAWPATKYELQMYERDVEALREVVVRLLIKHEGLDEAAARRVVAGVKVAR